MRPTLKLHWLLAATPAAALTWAAPAHAGLFATFDLEHRLFASYFVPPTNTF